ncbi:MAG: PEP/pyruvate-binding domain-containing protein, partial [Gemmobacter sp.]
MNTGRSAIVGGKAANLERLRDLGWHVPAFHTIPGADFTDAGALRPEAAEAHRRAMDALPGTSFAVRSSAVDEDGAEHSFAGQFLSLLDIPRDGVEDAATKVFRSGAEASVAAYRAQRGSAGQAPPSVIVQAMIDPHAAGVIFSADPVTSRPDRMVISSV